MAALRSPPCQHPPRPWQVVIPTRNALFAIFIKVLVHLVALGYISNLIVYLTGGRDLNAAIKEMDGPRPTAGPLELLPGTLR